MNARIETYKHIQKVQHIIKLVIEELLKRSELHDKSKLESPEVEMFDEYTDKLSALTYGSNEYNAMLDKLKPALDHHYANNRHHPQWHKNGIKDMNLIDIIEMLCDWMAASSRHNNGNINKSIDINQGRFGYSDELKQIMINILQFLETR